MRTGWGERELDLPPHPITAWAAARRERLSEQFPGERLVIPAGGFKVRANDTDYRFRTETAHTYLCGNQTSDAVLVMEGGEAVLYAQAAQLARDRRVLPGPAVRRAVGRPSPVAEGDLRLARCRDPPPRRPRRTPRWRRRRPACSAVPTRGSTRWSPATTAATTSSPASSPRRGWSRTSGRSASSRARATSPPSASRTASASGTACSEHGERWVEGTFFRRARTMGNDVGYELDRRWRPARHHAALGGQLRTDHARRAGAARHGRRGDVALHRRRHPHAAGRRHLLPAASASSTHSSSRPSRRGSTPSAPGPPSAPRTRRR